MADKQKLRVVKQEHGYLIELDGRDISESVTGLTLEMEADDWSHAEIRHIVHEVEVEGDFEITEVGRYDRRTRD